MLNMAPRAAPATKTLQNIVPRAALLQKGSPGMHLRMTLREGPKTQSQLTFLPWLT